MKVTIEGTTNIIKWYQPESSEECKSIDCRKCVFYSYVPSSSSCPFEAWMINHPVKKPTEPPTPITARKQMIEECNRCRSTETTTVINPIGIQILLAEINENIIKLKETQHEQPAPYPILIEYETVEKGQVGDLNLLPFMPNANEPEFGKDFYHRCIRKGRRLVGLLYDDIRDEHKCPLCGEVYLPK